MPAAPWEALTAGAHAEPCPPPVPSGRLLWGRCGADRGACGEREPEHEPEPHPPPSLIEVLLRDCLFARVHKSEAYMKWLQAGVGASAASAADASAADDEAALNAEYDDESDLERSWL